MRPLLRGWRGFCFAVFAALVVAGSIIATRAGDRLALWRIVHDQCVPDEKANGAPAPCEAVDLSGGEERGVAILKDLVGIAQFLAIPTRRLTGIESPELLAADAPNYWRAAWAARGAMEKRLGRTLPRQAVGMAINSSLARSQDQLHIHIDCIAPQIAATLVVHAGELTGEWRPLSVTLAGHRYVARRLDSPDLAGADPFRLLADGDPGARAHMALETLVAIGTRFADQDGFVLLADRADPSAGDLAHGEDLLDHRCAIVR